MLTFSINHAQQSRDIHTIDDDEEEEKGGSGEQLLEDELLASNDDQHLSAPSLCRCLICPPLPPQPPAAILSPNQPHLSHHCLPPPLLSRPLSPPSTLSSSAHQYWQPPNPVTYFHLSTTCHTGLSYCR